MRLLVTGDIHYALKQFDWLVGAAADYDGVVIVGDLLEVASTVGLEAQIVVVRTYLRRLAARVPVAVCSGNHDLNTEDSDGERVPQWLASVSDLGIAVDGGRRWFGDTMLSVFPWWDGPEAKARIAAQMAEDAREAPTTWIWAYHAPPGDSPTSWGGTRHFGDPDLRHWVETYQPAAVLCGHVHQAPFVSGGSWADRLGKSWVFNMGQQPGEVPAHIILDTAQRKAVWSSFDGSEMLDLAAGQARPEPLTAAPDWLRA